MSLITLRVLVLSVAFCLFQLAPVLGQDQDKNLENNRLSYLADPEIQKDIELVPGQAEQLQALHSNANRVFERLFSSIQDDLRSLPAEEQEKLVRKTQKVAQEQLRVLNEKASEILLPHQVKRLEQILVQKKIRAGGTAALLNSKYFRERVKLTANEVDALRKKEKEVIQQLKKEMIAIKAKARNEILSVLPEEKRKQFSALIGETFTVPSSESEAIEVFSFLRGQQ